MLFRSSIPVPVVVTVKLVGGAVAPMVPDKVKLSVAVTLKEYELLIDPLIAPEIICTPLLLTIEELLFKVIAPEYVLLPLVNRIAPPLDTPVPLIVIGSATVIPFEIFNEAFVETVVAPDVDPRPFA